MQGSDDIENLHNSNTEDLVSYYMTTIEGYVV